ncbi:MULTISPECIES: hypothetical protein [Photorhabdus]|uniref:Uncharacterized protein n=1 Tax=Photorhabdus bodei TaxID=2029681 RepID=A0AAW6BPU9_9GAMM|nr:MULTISPECIES: hypothetical protein [Photorhabdus]MDB6373890.1 hypothetical protein [Photorhabdus bodei]
MWKKKGYLGAPQGSPSEQQQAPATPETKKKGKGRKAKRLLRHNSFKRVWNTHRWILTTSLIDIREF